MARVYLYRKGTLLIPSGPARDPLRKHLHIICTDPDDDGMQLVVSVSSKKNDTDDTTCILQKFEHDWLVLESFTDYKFTNVWPHKKLERGVASNIFEPDVNLNTNSFYKVLNGIMKSPRTPPVMKAHYRALTTSDKAAA